MFNEEQRNKIKELFNGGKTHKEIALEFECPRRTIMKICGMLGLKRSVSEAASLKNKSILDNEKTVEEIKNLRNSKSLIEIAKIYNSSISSIQRLCNKYNIELNVNDYKNLQSSKMIESWPIEKRAKLKIDNLYKYYEKLAHENDNIDEDEFNDYVMNLVIKRLECDIENNKYGIIHEILYEDQDENEFMLKVPMDK